MGAGYWPGGIPSVIPAQAGIQNPGGFWRSDGRRWIPAFAGMTVGGGNDGIRADMALAVGGVSPSPNPLPLGEGFWRRDGWV